MGGHEYRVPAASIRTRTATPRLAARPSASAKFSSAGVVVKYVTDQRNGYLRGFNRGKHGRKGFVTVNQRLHAVASRQRFGDQPTDDAGEQFQVLCAFMLGLFPGLRELDDWRVWCTPSISARRRMRLTPSTR